MLDFLNNAAELGFKRDAHGSIRVQQGEPIGTRAWRGIAAPLLAPRSMRSAAGIAHFDVGPAWFWPGQQRMARLAQNLHLGIFEQYAAGTLVFEDQFGDVRRDLDFSTMAGALRIDGALAALIAPLAACLSPDHVKLNSAVTSITLKGRGVYVDFVGGTISAERVYLAVPPRIAAHAISFTPNLSPDQMQALQAIPTWMAAHAKVVAVYETAFWRQMGLSGDAMSHRGPLVEIHDASPADGRLAALFGFVGVPAHMRAQPDFDLETLSVAQIAALFGPQGANPVHVFIEDWAHQAFTATPADATAPTVHPVYGTPHALSNIWVGKIRLASSEMAHQFGGLLEGALEAAGMALP